MKKDIKKIFTELEKSKYDVSPRALATLQDEYENMDILLNKLNRITRYNIFDLPLAVFADVYRLEIEENQSTLGLGGDKAKIMDIAVMYNYTCSNLQKYMVSKFTINKVLAVHKILKKSLKEVQKTEQTGHPSRFYPATSVA